MCWSVAAPQPRAAVPHERASDALERAVLDELNLRRADPRGHAEQLRAMVAWYDGDLLRRPVGLPVRTVEGVAALHEAIDALERSGARNHPL